MRYISKWSGLYICYPFGIRSAVQASYKKSQSFVLPVHNPRQDSLHIEWLPPYACHDLHNILELYWITEILENLTQCNGNHDAGTLLGLTNFLHTVPETTFCTCTQLYTSAECFHKNTNITAPTNARCCGAKLGIFISGHVRMQLKEYITLTWQYYHTYRICAMLFPSPCHKFSGPPPSIST